MIKKKTKASPKKNDLSKLLRNHEHEWVALSPDYRKVLASGRNLDKVEASAGKRDHYTIKVPPFDMHYIAAI